ncbi:hypothetical protein WA158_005197 [Blastocystis sp. Blastoise]
MWIGGVIYFFGICIALVTNKLYIIERGLCGIGIGILIPIDITLCSEISFVMIRGGFFSFSICVLFLSFIICEITVLFVGTQLSIVVHYVSLVLCFILLFALFSPVDPYSYIIRQRLSHKQTDLEDNSTTSLLNNMEDIRGNLYEKVVDFYGEDSADYRTDRLYEQYIYEQQEGRRTIFKHTWFYIIFSVSSFLFSIFVSRNRVLYRTVYCLNELGYTYESNTIEIIHNSVISFVALIFAFLIDKINRKVLSLVGVSILAFVFLVYSLRSFFSDILIDTPYIYIDLILSLLYDASLGGIVFPCTLVFSQEYLPLSYRYLYSIIETILFLSLLSCQNVLSNYIAEYTSSGVLYFLSFIYCLYYICLLTVIKDTKGKYLEDIIDYE